MSLVVQFFGTQCSSQSYKSVNQIICALCVGYNTVCSVLCECNEHNTRQSVL